MRRLTLIVACLCLFIALPAAARAEAVPGSDHWEEHYSLDIQLGEFMGRMYHVLSDEQYYGRYPEVRGFAELGRRMGYFNLDNLSCEYSVSGGEIHYRFAEHFEGLPADSYIGKVVALPNRDLVSARYIAPEDYLVYFAMHNVPQQILLGLEEVGSMAAAPPDGLEEAFADLGEVGQVLGMMSALGIDKHVETILTGELALAFYNVPPAQKIMGGDIGPGDIDASIFVGLAGAEALDTLLATFGGQAGFTPIDSGSPAWKAWEISHMPGAGILYNDEILIAAPSLTLAAGHLQNLGGGMTVEDVQYYFDFNAARFHEQLVAPLADWGMGQHAQDGLQFPTAAMKYLWGTPEPAALGHITARSAYDSGYVCEMHMNTAVPNYLMYYLTTVGLGVLESEVLGTDGREDYGGTEYDEQGYDDEYNHQIDGDEELDELEDNSPANMPEPPVASEPAPTV